MKKHLVSSLLMLFTFMNVHVQGQTITCDDFVVNSMTPDASDDSLYQISISFNGPDSEFINYPFVEALTDCNGDTLAAGSMYWFGQFGQSTQDYPVEISETPECAPFTVSFTYLTNEGEMVTCVLPMGTTSQVETSEEELILYPNPASDFLFVKSSTSILWNEYTIADMTGRVIRRSRVTMNEPMDIRVLAPGIYMLYTSATSSAGQIFIRQ